MTTPTKRLHHHSVDHSECAVQLLIVVIIGAFTALVLFIVDRWRKTIQGVLSLYRVAQFVPCPAHDSWCRQTQEAAGEKFGNANVQWQASTRRNAAVCAVNGPKIMRYSKLLCVVQ